MSLLEGLLDEDCDPREMVVTRRCTPDDKRGADDAARATRGPTAWDTGGGVPASRAQGPPPSTDLGLHANRSGGSILQAGSYPGGTEHVTWGGAAVVRDP